LQPFLEISDFGYAVSTSILEPALKARWTLYVGGASLAGETSFEAPLDEDGSDTETLRAQMTVRFGDALDSVSLRASAGDKGDGLLLVGRQTIQLLNIWRESNDRVEDLGALGRPSDVPMAMLFYLFDKANPADARQDLRERLMKLLLVLPYPLLQRSAVSSASLSGFASAPLKTVLMRWGLKTVFDDVATDTHGPVVSGRL
jgi:hypothetical protein